MQTLPHEGRGLQQSGTETAFPFTYDGSWLHVDSSFKSAEIIGAVPGAPATFLW